MEVVCLDLEGVLVPEIWINVAKKTGIPELRLTTRDISDYDKLMRMRLKILKENGIRLSLIQRVISKIEPLPGAKNFLTQIRKRYPVIILSDTFYEFAMPLMQKLGQPALFCNWLEIDAKGFVSGYRLRQRNGKEKSVRALKNLGFKVKAAGDSYNDITMLKSADKGILFNPPPGIQRQFPQFAVATTHNELFRQLTR